MSRLTLYRAKAILLGATLIATCFFTSFPYLTQAQSSAPQAPNAEDPTVKQVAAYKTWERVNAEPQFVNGGRRGRS